MNDAPTIALLRTFLVVAQERHFARAAKKLNMSAPALSQRISRLEHLAGTPLFERHPYALTAAGQSLLETAEAAVRAADAAACHLTSLAAGSRATLRVGVLSHGAGALTAATIRAFEQQEPGVAITVRGIDFPDIISSVVNQHVDVAFVRPTLGDARLDEYPLVEEQRYAILPQWDDRAHLPCVTLDDLDRDAFLSPAAGTPDQYRRFLHLVDDRNGEQPRHLDSHCRRAEDFLIAVAAGLGVASTIKSFRDYYPWHGIAYVPITNAAHARTSLVTTTEPRELVRRFRDQTITIATTAGSAPRRATRPATSSRPDLTP